MVSPKRKKKEIEKKNKKDIPIKKKKSTETRFYQKKKGKRNYDMPWQNNAWSIIC